MILIEIYCLIYLAAFVVTIWLANKARQFQNRHPAIADSAGLAAFKNLARVNMYFALAQIGVLAGGIGLGLVLIFRHGFAGFLFVTAANIILLLLSLRSKKIETAVRSLSVTDEHRSEYEHVCQSWVKKPFPDF